MAEKKLFVQLLGAGSTQKLVKMHNIEPLSAKLSGFTKTFLSKKTEKIKNKTKSSGGGGWVIYRN